MNTWKKTGKIFVVLIVALLLLTPITMLYMISYLEQTQYQRTEVLEFKNLAYGDICEVVRMDVQEEILVSGKVVSAEVIFLELNQYSEPHNIRLIVEEGEQICEGDIIGYYKESPIISTQNGIIMRISIGSDSYLMLESLENLVLEVKLRDRNLVEQWKDKGLQLTDKSGKIYVIDKIKNMEDANGSVTAYLRCENGTLSYGAGFSDMVLMTERIFRQTLVVEKACVYSLSGDGTYYVRCVNSDGEFLREAEVVVGYECGDYICIGGVEEGTLCDAGYKAVAESGGIR